jgi:hypothetical protein
MFSPDRLLERTVGVYTAALSGYQAWMNSIFHAFAGRLPTAATLPAQLVGELEIARDGSGGPVLSWYLDPLPAGSQSIVKISLGEESRSMEEIWKYLDARYETLRQPVVDWLYPVMNTQALPVFDLDSARKLAYSWLEDDLQEGGWR